MNRFLLIVSWLALQGVSLASVSNELLEQLQTEMRNYASTHPPGEARENYSIQQFAMLLSRENPEGDETGGENLAQVVVQLALTAPTDKMREIAKALGPQLKKEQADRTEEYAAKLAKTVGDALRTCLGAKTAQEMDEPLATTSKLLRGGNRGSQDNHLLQLHQQAQQAFELMKQLQNLVPGSTNEDGEERRQNWRNLLSSQYDFSEFVPRSELLAKLKELGKGAEGASKKVPLTQEEWNDQINEKLAGIKTLEDMAETLAILQDGKLNRGHVFSNQLMQEMLALNSGYQDIKRGLAGTIVLTNLTNRMSGSSNNTNPILLDNLRAQLVLFALPRLLQVSPEDSPKPEESLTAYLQRTLTQAKEKRDWALVGRVLTLAQQISAQIGATSTDMSALNSFLSGYNFERARIYTAAVRSYLSTLKTGSQIIPPEYIGDLLDALKKEHPSDYELAQQMPPELTPGSADATMRARMGYPPGMNPLTNYPSYPGSSAPTGMFGGGARLTVPAATPPAKSPEKAGDAQNVGTPAPAAPPTTPPVTPASNSSPAPAP